MRRQIDFDTFFFVCKNMVFNFSYWSDGKCQEKLKIIRMQNLEPISIQAEKGNHKRKKKKKREREKEKNASEQ